MIINSQDYVYIIQKYKVLVWSKCYWEGENET